MKISSFRLVCLGLFLFAVTSMRVDAADLPDAGPVYMLAMGNSCGGSPTVTIESRGRSPLLLSRDVVAIYDALSPTYAPIYLDSYSSLLIPTDGTCITAVLHLNGVAGINVHFWMPAIVSKPPTVGYVSDYSIQDILVIGFAFMSMCAGWVVGARLA